jgi:NAD-dependent SIR2 family protein deacetylase
MKTKNKRSVKCIRCETYVSPQEWEWFKEEGSLPICDHCCFKELDEEDERKKF